jgi:methyltransferase
MSASALLYTGFIALTALERLLEVRVSNRHAAWAFAHGGEEHGREHFPAMVALHTAFLVLAPLEVWLLGRVFSPALGFTMLGVALATQALRWWCISTLGPRWNTRVIVVPGLPRVTAGPYRLLRHPNYVAVVLEGIALPLIHGAWITAVLFTVLNAMLLRVRIRVEEQALKALERLPVWARPVHELGPGPS